MPRSSQIAGAIAALLVSFGGAWPSARQTKLPSPICASSESVPELLTEGQRLADEWNRHARQCFERAVPIAERSGDRALEAHARLALARAAFYNADYVVAGEQAAGARDLFEALGNRLQVAHASTTMGLVAYPQGKVEVARRHFEAALSTYASIGSGKDRASTLINIAYTLPRGHPDEFRLVTEAVAVARTIEAPILEGRALHLRGDRHFRDGRFDEAISDLNQAIERLRGAAAQGSHTSLANAYVSLGRVYRAHGQPGRAIEHYERAAELQERTGEIRGLMQSTNAKAIVLGILGRFDESRQAYERALSLARQVGIDRLVNIQQGNLAGAHPAADDYQGAIRLLEEVVAREREANTLAYRHGSLASYYAVLKRYDVAIEHAERAIEYGRKAATRDHLAFLWYRRAVVNRALGRVDEALADAQAAVQVVEELRRRLVPLDFMKQGFSEMYQSIFGLTLALVHARGEADNALIVGEQARARVPRPAGQPRRR